MAKIRGGSPEVVLEGENVLTPTFSTPLVAKEHSLEEEKAPNSGASHSEKKTNRFLQAKMRRASSGNALKTVTLYNLRRLPLLGDRSKQLTEKQINFRWPSTEKELFSITKDPHTKLEQLTICNSFAWYGIQLHFTNGFKSPLFMTSFKEDRQTATHRIDTLRNIRKIAVKDWKPQICGLKMMDGKGKDLLSLEWCALGTWQT